MPRFVLPLLAACAVFALEAAAQSVAWNRVVAGSSTAPATLGDGRIVTRSLSADRSGNVYLAGSVVNAGAREFFTARISADGSTAWQRTFGAGGGSDHRALSLAVDAQGDVVVVGSSAGPGGSDIRVIKYAAADGAVAWQRALDWGQAELGYFAAVDASGNAFVAGESLNASGNSDVRIVKLAAATGATLWQQLEDTGRDDYVSDLAVDAAGELVMLGVSRNAAGNDDIRVVKYSATGARRWQQLFDFGGADMAAALMLDAAGNPVIAASSTSATTDYRTFKLSAASGAVSWQKTFDGGGTDIAQDLAVDSGGNVVVTGYSEQRNGRYSFKTLKYAADGTQLWEATFDAGSNNYAYRVAVDASDNVIVAGSSTNASGNTDWKAIAYAGANGAIVGEASYAGPAGQSDDAYAVVAVPGGAVLAGISTESAGSTSVRALKFALPVASAGRNVALASAGATASASSTYGSWLASRTIDNERAGTGWANGGGGWVDATPGGYPDWLQVSFSGNKTIDRVVVYTLQDNYNAPAEPGDSTTFATYGIRDFTVQGWNGSSWVTLGTVTGNTLVKRTVTFSAFTTDRIRVNVTNGGAGYSRITEVEAWGEDAGASAPSGPPASGTNVALASAGATASASSTYGSWLPSRTIDNERAGTGWANGGGGWVDGTPAGYPDWLQVGFSGNKTIDRVVVYTLQDNYNAPTEPGDSTTFSTYGIRDFTVQGWNGSSWVTLATVTGNNLVKRTVTFGAFTTDRIRVNVTHGGTGYSRITEVEAWGEDAPASPPSTPSGTNVALASAGAKASASSTYGPWLASRTIDNERRGVNWANGGGGWVDATPGGYPDWLQVDFSGNKTIDRVVVYTLQDNYNSPAEPTDSMTFTTYGIRDFTVQGWNGSAWVTLATVSGNTSVKRTLTFAAFTTDRIRVNVTHGGAGYSRITEIEAWGS